MLRPFRRRRRDDGAAAVEFALVVPILILLVFGIIEFGIAFAQKLSLSNGARQAARYAVVNQNPCSEVLSQLQSGATTIGMSSSEISMNMTLTSGAGSPQPICSYKAGTGGGTGTWTSGSPTTQACANSSPGDAVTVEAEFPGQVSIPLAFTANITLTGDGVYRCEYS